jgi:hypothetical protein
MRQDRHVVDANRATPLTGLVHKRRFETPLRRSTAVIYEAYLASARNEHDPRRPLVDGLLLLERTGEIMHDVLAADEITGCPSGALT